jgi:hypothetical protein
MKKIIILALALVMLLSLFTACGDKTDTGSTGGNSTAGTSQSGENKGGGERWADNDLTKLVPKPNVGTIGEITLNGDDTCLLSMEWDFEDAKAYVEQAKSAGYTLKEFESDNTDAAFGASFSWFAYNSYGNVVEIGCEKSGDTISGFIKIRKY